MPPPEAEARSLLREIYYRQSNHRRAHGRYASTLDSLGVAHRLMRGFLWPPVMKVSDYAYEAWTEEVEDLHGDGHISRWVIASDSRVWKVDPPAEE